MVTVRRLLARRAGGARFRAATDLGFAGQRLQKAAAYLASESHDSPRKYNAMASVMASAPAF